jgi:hypothetical protein
MMSCSSRCSKAVKDDLAMQIKEKEIAKKNAKEVPVYEAVEFQIEIDSSSIHSVDFLVEKPKDLEAYVITRRRKTNAVDFQKELITFQKESETLTKACSEAEKRAGLAKSSVEGFQKTREKLDFSKLSLSIPRIRWIKAIERVILLNAVQLYTRMWERSMYNPDRAVDTAGIKPDYRSRSMTIIEEDNEQYIGEAMGEIVTPRRRFRGVNITSFDSFDSFDSNYFDNSEFDEYLPPVRRASFGDRYKTKNISQLCSETLLPLIGSTPNSPSDSPSCANSKKIYSRYSFNGGSGSTSSNSFNNDITKLPSIHSIDIKSDLVNSLKARSSYTRSSFS